MPVTIKLTDEQLVALAPIETVLKVDKGTRYAGAVLGEVYLLATDRQREIGTARFFYIDPTAHAEINKAIVKAMKGMRERGTYLP